MRIENSLFVPFGKSQTNVWQGDELDCNLASHNKGGLSQDLANKKTLIEKFEEEELDA